MLSSQSFAIYCSYNFGVYFSNHVSVPELFCSHHGLGSRSMTAGWSLVSILQHFDHGGHHIFSSCSLSLPVEWCSVVQLFFFFKSVVFPFIEQCTWGSEEMGSRYFVSGELTEVTLGPACHWRNHMPK